MNRLRAGLALLAALALAPRTAAAFTIASGFSQSCHERLGLAAMAQLLDELDFDNVTLPSSDLWRKVAAEIAPAVLQSAGTAAAAQALTDATNASMSAARAALTLMSLIPANLGS